MKNLSILGSSSEQTTIVRPRTAGPLTSAEEFLHGINGVHQKRQEVWSRHMKDRARAVVGREASAHQKQRRCCAGCLLCLLAGHYCLLQRHRHRHQRNRQTSCWRPRRCWHWYRRSRSCRWSRSCLAGLHWHRCCCCWETWPCSGRLQDHLHHLQMLQSTCTIQPSPPDFCQLANTPVSKRSDNCGLPHEERLLVCHTVPL